MAGSCVQENRDKYLLNYTNWIIVSIGLFIVVMLLSHQHDVCEDCQQFFTRPNMFLKNNSKLDLKQIRDDMTFATDKIGQHYAGSYNNEVILRNYLVLRMQNLVNVSSSNNVRAEFDEQISNEGSFNLGFAVKTYTKLRNLILRFYGNNSTSVSQPALLINCHYDSALGSPGASDDFVSCATMLEFARHLSLGHVDIKHDIILLFNGGEESILVSSHAFMTQHVWAKDIKAFINLEGAGAGGRLFMFQSGPGVASEFLLEAYSMTVLNPLTSIFSQEIFQKGLIPSDTDYRIFRDYGLIPGLDMAYSTEGYAYHTMYDTSDRILDSCISLAVYNLMSVSKYIVNDERFTSIENLTPHPDIAKYSSKDPRRSKVAVGNYQKYVFFDFFGIFTAIYTFAIDELLHYILIVCITVELLFYYTKFSVKGLLLAMALQIVWLAVTFGYILLSATFYHNFGIKMTWFNNRYNIFGLYILPSIIITIFYHCKMTSIYDKSSIFLRLPKMHAVLNELKWTKHEGKHVLRDMFCATRLILLLFSIPFMLLKIPLFLFQFIITLPTIISFVLDLLKSKPTHPANTFLIILTPSAFLIYFITLLLDFFVPLFGRAGNLFKPDIVVAIIVMLAIITPGLYMSPFLKITQRKVSKMFINISIQTYIALLALILLTPYGFPYGQIKLGHVPDSYPPSYRHQRVRIQHVNRILRDETNNIVTNDTGLYFVPMDVNGAKYLKPDFEGEFNILRKFKSYFFDIKSVEKLRNVRQYECQEEYPSCGMPHIYPLEFMYKDAYYIPLNNNKRLLGIPTPEIKVVAKHVVNSGPEYKLLNITLSVSNYLQQIVLNFRMDTNKYILKNASFDLGGAEPAMSKLSKFTENSSHYYISRINQAGVKPGEPNEEPWQFWITVLKNKSLVFEESNIDVAISTHVADLNLSFGYTDSLKSFLRELPEWVVPTIWTSTYEHWKLHV